MTIWRHVRTIEIDEHRYVCVERDSRSAMLRAELASLEVIAVGTGTTQQDALHDLAALLARLTNKVREGARAPQHELDVNAARSLIKESHAVHDRAALSGREKGLSAALEAAIEEIEAWRKGR